jgi:Tol biopolymer transport system component
MELYTRPKMQKLILLLICISFATSASNGLKVVSEPVKLVGGDGSYFMHPVWAPDGSKIAFAGSNYQGLWIMNSDDSEVHQITDEPAAGYGFEWSSDSRAIVSRVAKYEEKYRYNAIKVFDLEKDTARLLTDYRTFMPGLPHWADTDEKVYMYGRGKLEVFDSGKKAAPLQKRSANKQIYFLKNDHIAVGNITTKEYKVFEPVKEHRYINMVVSPDGLRIAFEVIGGNLYVMNINGNELVDLGEGHRPQWAPDSQYLVYMITEDDGHQYLSSGIYSIKIDGTEKVRLTSTDNKLEMNPSWSPDGNKIAFDVMGEGAIYVIELSE